MPNIFPTITINGTASTTITGLLICSLPPISKPPIRALAEEIDGRDGDEITELGYSAIDKEFTIGLAGSYNIDDVIKFFNSKGVITFSNEPTKYYKFGIYEEIDFEKLIRYKRATVRAHVQPFKYSTTETAQTFNFSPSESSGSCSISNSGNYYSKPEITVEGSGNVELSLNGNVACVLDMSSTSKIVLDCESLNATDGAGNLKNRMVSGSLENLYLKAGANSITYTGTISKIIVKNYSRWI